MCVSALYKYIFPCVLHTGIFKHTQELLRGYLADVIPAKDHSHVYGNLNAAANIGFIVGPVIGGHLSDLPSGFNIAAFASASIFLINFSK